MPRLWHDSIEAHRRAVRDATLDTAAALVAEHGLASVTMSRVAEETGIGRATLYKYFPNVEAILEAWHQRQIERHLRCLAEVSNGSADPVERLEAVLEAFAFMSREHHTTELAALLHRGDAVVEAEHHLTEFIRELLVEGKASGRIRNDVAPEELARYCLHALTAAGSLPSAAAVRRLVAVILSGLRPPPT